MVAAIPHTTHECILAAVCANMCDDVPLCALIDFEAEELGASEKRVDFLKGLMGAKWEKMDDPMGVTNELFHQSHDRYFVLRVGVSEFAYAIRLGHGKQWNCRVTFAGGVSAWRYPLRSEENRYGTTKTSKLAKSAAWCCLIREGGR